MQKGVEAVSHINPNLGNRLVSGGLLAPEAYVAGILRGDVTLLSKAITLIESALPAHQQLAQQVVNACLPHSGKSVRIGITGVPGVGKSTFIEAFGLHLINHQQKKVAVLAVDPSSQKTKGSILGDKTRMEQLSVSPNAYIRPSASAGSLGGVARKTRETIVLCEAAGFDTILIETVGVGQSETAVKSMVDFFLLLLLPGAGDELQGIKRGIMEMADAIAINKADGANEKRAQVAAADIKRAIAHFPPHPQGWQVAVSTISSMQNSGMAELWLQMDKYVRHMTIKGFFKANRQEQDIWWLRETLTQNLLQNFYAQPQVKQKLQEIETKVRQQKISPFAAARDLLDIFLK